jgi:hypothetical protein
MVKMRKSFYDYLILPHGHISETLTYSHWKVILRIGNIVVRINYDFLAFQGTCDNSVSALVKTGKVAA